MPNNQQYADPETFTPREALAMRLTCLALDIYRLQAELETPQAEEYVAGEVERYWRAFTHGWGRQQHGRVYFVQCLEEVKESQVMVTVFSRLARSRLSPGSTPPPLPEWAMKLFEPAIKLLEGDGQVNAENVQVEFSPAEAVRYAFARAYPIEARRLSDDDIEQALAEHERKGGAIPTGSGKQPKWDFLESVCERAGLGPVDGKLEGQWGDWKKKLRRAEPKT